MLSEEWKRPVETGGKRVILLEKIWSEVKCEELERLPLVLLWRYCEYGGKVLGYLWSGYRPFFDLICLGCVGGKRPKLDVKCFVRSKRMFGCERVQRGRNVRMLEMVRWEGFRIRANAGSGCFCLVSAAKITSCTGRFGRLGSWNEEKESEN